MPACTVQFLLNFHPLDSPDGRYVLLATAALVAGILNAVAGGGSFFSFPALLGLNLPPVNANATNAVALWPGQVLSMVAFRQELHANRKLVVPATFASVLGGIAGAVTLLFTRQETFMRLVPWLLLFGTVLFALSEPSRQWFERLRPRPEKPLKPVSFSAALFFWVAVVSFYIGYFGAGAGFLAITLFSLFGIRSFHEVNALKVLCTTAANGVAVLTFVAANAVYWREGLIMMMLAGAGGYFGAAVSRKLNPRPLRAFIVAAGMALSIYFFWKTT